jgi:hypothetical protein
VEMSNKWKDLYGPLPPRLQSSLKTLHLHACTRTLGIDLVGFVDNGDGTKDCVLRSPGLRPRHWAHISQFLPRKVPTKGIDAVFPSRFTKTDVGVTMTGGMKVDLTILDPSNEDDEEEWDALDEEEVEAMKEISSAMYVRSIDEVDMEDYPRFVIRGMNSIKAGSRVDLLLRTLLPASKVVHAKQSADKEKARLAADIREKREAMKKQKKEQDAMTSRRIGYNL